MSDKTSLLRHLTVTALVVVLLTATGVQAQSYRMYRSGREGTLPRPITGPEKAAKAARQATGGRVLGVRKSLKQDGQQGYRVRILRDGRVRDFHYDPDQDQDTGHN
ncbi:MAG: hypothetical protein CSA09_03875 [Candidatus Contendobacter odensis]|uniref:PepSY domain-containing protein n=1 Tax=Candidatus Contendibacter odensensis TaxID=1400860 RepID=A0A2G6PEW2_9GAMM|nr:MAG: hypothetical protein CSA09_03875 [Candidatus Contendobacter odensis]